MVIDLYRIYDINNLTDSLYDRYFSMMSKSRKEKVEAVKDKDSRKRTVAGEMLAKQMLSEQSGKREEDIVIEVGENGKPFSNIMHFSISHTENLVVCAVAENRIGVDIEKIRPYNDKLARRITNDKEYEYINQDAKKFIEIWTLKEAIIKKDGKGICAIKTTDALSQINKQKYVYKDFIIHLVF